MSQAGYTHQEAMDKIVELEEKLRVSEKRAKYFVDIANTAEAQVEKLMNEKYEPFRKKMDVLEAQVGMLSSALKYIYNQIDDEDNPSENNLKWIKDSCDEALTKLEELK